MTHIPAKMMGRSRPVRLAYLVTHPIQYQAPLLKRIAADPEFDLEVFFCSDISVRPYHDTGFGRAIEWDVPLLDGYAHRFLPALGGRDRLSFWRPFNHDFWRRLGQFDVLWVHGYARAFHLSSIAAAKTHGCKVLVRDEASEISADRSRAKQLAKRFFFACLRRLADGFLAIGTLNREYYLANGISPDRIFTVPYAVDNDRFRRAAEAARANRETLRRELGLKAGRAVILYASKLVARKRPGDLLAAYRQLIAEDGTAAPYLLFVGDGEERVSLEQRAANAGLEGARFLGFKGQTELPAYFDLADVFVLPSEREPWGLVVNEAMNAARAVVVSDRVCCARDLVRDGDNGYVFETANVADLAAALRRVVADPEKCRAMGRRSLEIVSDWDYAADIRGLKAACQAVLDGNNEERP